MKKLLIILVIIILILLTIIGYLLFDLGVSKTNGRILILENQTIINTQNIQKIVDFINTNVKK